MRLVSRLLVLALLVATFADCAGTNSGGINITPEQAWNAGKAAAKGIGVGIILTTSKDGKILGVSSADAIAEVGPVVDTLASDFQPGAHADADARAKTRALAASQFARALFKSDFNATDEGAADRQATDIAAVRAIIDPIADSLLATFGK